MKKQVILFSMKNIFKIILKQPTIIMAKLWIISAGDFDGSQNIIPVIANSKAQVGAHIKNNVEKFMPIFEGLFFCKHSHGDVYRHLRKWYSEENFLNTINDNKDYRAKFIDAVKKVLNSMTDNQIIEQLPGYNGATEECIYVCINETPLENLCDIRQ